MRIGPNFLDYEIIPLGVNCAAAHFLRRQNLRKHAYPFDWIVAPLNSVLSIFKSSFPDIFSEGELHYLPPENRILYDDDEGNLKISETMITPVISKKYQLLFPHDFPIDARQNLNTIKAKYQRRFERLKELLNSDKKVIFIVNFGADEVNDWQINQYLMAGIKYPDSNPDDVNQLNRFISTNHPNLDFKIMHFQKYKRQYLWYKRLNRILGSISRPKKSQTA